MNRRARASVRRTQRASPRVATVHGVLRTVVEGDDKDAPRGPATAHAGPARYTSDPPPARTSAGPAPQPEPRPLVTANDVPLWSVETDRNGEMRETLNPQVRAEINGRFSGSVDDTEVARAHAIERSLKVVLRERDALARRDVRRIVGAVVDEALRALSAHGMLRQCFGPIDWAWRRAAIKHALAARERVPKEHRPGGREIARQVTRATGLSCSDRFVRMVARPRHEEDDDSTT